MHKIFRMAALLGAVLFIQGCEQPAQNNSIISLDEPAVVKLTNVLEGYQRADENKLRDQYRHPLETLSFFSVTPDATVVEIWPGSGWYTEILAPYLRDEGHYIAAGFDPESEIEFIRMAAGRYQAKLDADPDVYDQVETAVLMPPDRLDFVAPESVDIILTFRSLHNWMPRGSEDMMLAAMYRALKPGGVLGVVEHRGNPALPQNPEAETGYVNQIFAVEMIEKAGFVLNGSSEINANPLDTKDHPEGVWTLPPTLRMKDERREHWLEIGESDRFTLRFIKPEN
jgi:predicted methyltransferase